MTVFEYIVQLISAFFGSMGFALLFNIKRQHLIIGSLGGFISWGVYLIVFALCNNEPVGYFFGALAANLYSEIIARIIKTPTTTILVSSLIPLIPGGALYYTMRYFYNREWELFTNNGLRTLSLALAIALGIIVVSTAIKLLTAITTSIDAHKKTVN